MKIKDVKEGMWFRVKKAPKYWSSAVCNYNPLHESFPMDICIEKVRDRGAPAAVKANGFGWDLKHLLEVSEPIDPPSTTDNFKFML